MKAFFSLASASVPTHTISVPDGADLTTYLPMMNSGDTLSLAENGSYTLGAGVRLGSTTPFPNGYPRQHTKIRGNGATITGGQNGLYLYDRSYIDIYDLNLEDQTQYCQTLDYCHHITWNNCTYTSTLGTDFVDVSKIYRSDNLTFDDCEILATTGDDTCDGFEFWGPCNHVVMRNCSAHEITGTVASPDHHAFEVYGNTAGEECDDIQFINCEAYGCEVGFSCEGGAVGGISHTNIITDGCSSHDNNNYGYQGIQGSTLYRRNHASGDNTGNGSSETNGSVTDLS